MDPKDTNETKVVEPTPATTAAEAGPADKPGNVATTTVAAVDPDVDTSDNTADAAKAVPEAGKAENPTTASGTTEARESEGANKTTPTQARVDDKEESAIGPALPADVDATGSKLVELPAYLANNVPLRQFFEALPKIISKVGHNEMWGITLKDSKNIPTVNTLIKFLRANDGNIDEAIAQLHKALTWRKLNKPLELMTTAFSEEKFKDLGFVTMYDGPTGSGNRIVVTWNIYGAAKDVKTTFEDTKE